MSKGAGTKGKTGQPTQVVALMGNPNVGKSTLFNRLTGLQQHTGNWPGKTVEVARGRCTIGGRNWELVDLPGTYALLSHSPEEEVARAFVAGGEADALVVVCDATSLERNLNLALQAMELTDRVVICVNLMDEAQHKGVRVDIDALSQELGVPVVGAAARQGKGLHQLLAALDGVLAQPAAAQETGGYQPRDPAEAYARASQIAAKCIQGTGKAAWEKQLRLDRVLTSRKAGIPLMLALLATALWITIAGANAPSALLMEALLWLQDQLGSLLLSMGAPAWLHGALVLGAFRVLAWVVAVMLPPMAIFFPLFTLLEDVGYLPRVAFNLDRCFCRCHACGKQALTMCMVHSRMQRQGKSC